jgi:hypothetical protein
LKKILIVLGRENLHKDSYLYQNLFENLKQKNLEIRFDPVDELNFIHLKIQNFSNRLKPNKLFLSLFSKWLKLKFLLKFRHFGLGYFKLQEPNQRDFDFRKLVMSYYLQTLPKNREIYLVGRSAGAIIATQIADEFKVKQVICLGYPFKHPDNNEESNRTEHLQTIRTSTIIIQGKRDVYGSKDFAQKLSLSDAIDIIELDTDHEYRCGKKELTLVKKIITQALS